MEKKYENCKHYVMCIWTEYYKHRRLNCIHFLDNNRDKPQTNRQWLESLSNEEYAINIRQIYMKLLQICLEKRADNEDCTMEHLIMDWLKAEHKE